MRPQDERLFGAWIERPDEFRPQPARGAELCDLHEKFMPTAQKNDSRGAN